MKRGGFLVPFYIVSAFYEFKDRFKICFVLVVQVGRKALFLPIYMKTLHCISFFHISD